VCLQAGRGPNGRYRRWQAGENEAVCEWRNGAAGVVSRRQSHRESPRNEEKNAVV